MLKSELAKEINKKDKEYYDIEEYLKNDKEKYNNWKNGKMVPGICLEGNRYILAENKRIIKVSNDIDAMIFR